MEHDLCCWSATRILTTGLFSINRSILVSGALTSDGDKAVSCILNGASIAALAEKHGLSAPVVLGLAAPIFGMWWNCKFEPDAEFTIYSIDIEHGRTTHAIKPPQFFYLLSNNNIANIRGTNATRCLSKNWNLELNHPNPVKR